MVNVVKVKNYVLSILYASFTLQTLKEAIRGATVQVKTMWDRILQGEAAGG